MFFIKYYFVCCCLYGFCICVFVVQKGGCIIVDVIRKGKCFLDSMFKILFIWVCVINCVLVDLCKSFDENLNYLKFEEDFFDFEENSLRRYFLDWDCQFYLFIWVLEIEKNNIVNCLDIWVEDFKNCGVNLIFFVQMFRKFFRMFWVFQKIVIWLNEIVDIEILDFIFIFLVLVFQLVSCF